MTSATPRIPSPRSAAVRATEREILAMCSADSRWSRFLTDYLRHALNRTAWNCHLVDGALAPGQTWLDVGSFGIDPLWALRRRPDLDVHAVSYEGMRVWLTADGITHEPGGRNVIAEIAIGKVDVERDAFPLPDASCDLVTCFEAIEHLRSTPKPLLDEIRRVLKPTGHLLLTTPNLVGSRALIRALAGKSPQENPRYHRLPHYGVVHPKEYTMRELVQLLDGRGLEPVVCRSLYFRRRSPVDWLCMLPAMVTRPLGGILLGIGPQPVLLGDNLLVVAKKHDRAREQWPSLVFEPPPFSEYE